MSRQTDPFSANPADQATTPRERQLMQAQAAQRVEDDADGEREAELATSVRDADRLHIERIAQLRGAFMAAHPGATDSDFERALPDLERPPD